MSQANDLVSLNFSFHFDKMAGDTWGCRLSVWFVIWSEGCLNSPLKEYGEGPVV